jgi:hypothetical protein
MARDGRTLASAAADLVEVERLQSVVGVCWFDVNH